MRWTKPLALTLLAVILIGAGASTSKVETAPTRYVDPIEGFSLAPPATVQPLKERAVVATFPVGVDDGFVSNINIIIDPVKKSRDEYMEASLNELRQSNPGAKYNSTQKTQVSGKDAEFVDFEANMGAAPKRRLRFLQLIVFDSDRVYIVTCTAPLDSFAPHEAEFHKCIDSFKLEK
jgi:hypothetical protein